MGVTYALGMILLIRICLDIMLNHLILRRHRHAISFTASRLAEPPSRDDAGAGSPRRSLLLWRALAHRARARRTRRGSYHAVLGGSGVLDDGTGGPPLRLVPGD